MPDLTDADLDDIEQVTIDARVYRKQIGCGDCAENGPAYCEVHGAKSDDSDPMRAAVRQLVAEVRRLRILATHEPGRTVVNAEGLPVTYCACGLEWPCRRADRALSAAIGRAEAAEAVIKSQGEPK